MSRCDAPPQNRENTPMHSKTAFGLYIERAGKNTLIINYLDRIFAFNADASAAWTSASTTGASGDFILRLLARSRSGRGLNEAGPRPSTG
jgi:hypothetical protein